jgi:hypothetical protein
MRGNASRQKDALVVNLFNKEIIRTTFQSVGIKSQVRGHPAIVAAVRVPVEELLYVAGNRHGGVDLVAGSRKGARRSLE